MRMTTALGWQVGWSASSTTLSVNSGNLAAVAFVALGSQVSEIYVPVTGVGSGGVPAGYLRCRIVPEDAANNYLPNMSNVIATATSDSDITASGQWAHFTFSSHTLTTGTRYWAVFDNTHGTGTVTVAAEDYSIFNSFNYQWAAATYTTSWAYSGTAKRFGESIAFTNNKVWGIALYGTSSDGMTVYGSRMSGLKIQTGSVGYNLTSVGMWGGASGTPGCTITYAVYQGSSLVAETFPMFGAQENGSTIRLLTFPSPVTLQPNQTYRIVLRNTNGDGSSTSYYRLTSRIQARSASDASMLWKPLGFQNCVYTETTDGTNWTDDTNRYYPRRFIMALDETEPFVISGGSSGSGFPIPPHLIIT